MKSISKYSDKELFDGIVKKDENIIEAIYTRYFHSIRQFIKSNSGNEADAEDVFQEALIVLYQKFSTSDFRLTSALNTYLYSVARILWFRELRKRKTLFITDEIIDIQSQQNIIESIERKERLDLFREKYEELSEDCKKILHLFLNNIPIREITRLMGYSSDQHTKNRRLRCKMSLINRIKSSEYFNELSNGKNQDD